MTEKTVAIFDIDGTLALRTGRDPYDETRVGEDAPNWPVFTILSSLYQSGIDPIFVSARKESSRKDTAIWLAGHLAEIGVFTAMHLFMRADGDYRKDVEVKEDILDFEILPKFTIFAVFDDRDQTVQMWRRRGFTCLQVRDGNF